MYLFGYGSLMNRTSAENVLKRPLLSNDLIPALLHGFQRCWRAKEELFFEFLGRKAQGVFLDLREIPHARVNGALIQVTPEELTRLKLREKNYQCIDVSLAITELPPRGRVYTFRCRPEHWLREGETDAFIPARYMQMVRSGFQEVGPAFLRLYEETTEPSQLPVLNGSYRFVDPIQALHV